MMKLAVMQPYFMAYLGYWQLLNFVDKFVIYDDVNYIKGGWVNRNRIYINNSPVYMTIPLIHASPNKKIYELEIDPSSYWKKKLIKKVEINYKKSIYYEEIFPVFEEIVFFESNKLGDFLFNSIRIVSNFIGIETDIKKSSECYDNSYLKGEKRIIDICKKEKASCYINLSGGKDLYHADKFRKNDINLCFSSIDKLFFNEQSFNSILYMSLLEILMMFGKEKTKEFLCLINLECKDAF